MFHFYMNIEEYTFEMVRASLWKDAYVAALRTGLDCWKATDAANHGLRMFDEKFKAPTID